MSLRLVPLVLAVLLLGTSLPLAATEQRVLEGEWRWSQGVAGDLEARFTEREDGRWEVAFHFDFRRRPHVYRGVATGDPGRGPLSGTVRSEGGRTFRFEGRFRDGRLDGRHFEVFRGGREQPTGTLRLGRRNRVDAL